MPQTLDYKALAEQVRGTPTPPSAAPPIDYKALAEQVRTAPEAVKPVAARAATPPPAPSTWSMVKDAARSFPRQLLNAGDLGLASDAPNQISTETAAGMAGGALGSAAVLAAAPEAAGAAGLVGVARAVPWAWRAAAGATSIASAGAAGGGAAALEGNPIGPAAAWQAALQTGGMAGGWLFNAAGRRILGSRVAQEVVTRLGDTKLASVQVFRDILTAAQDAMDSHTARQAAAKVARGQAIDPLRATAAGAAAEAKTAGTAATYAKSQGEARTAALTERWPQSEAAVAPPMRPVAAHGGPPAPARYKYDWPADMGGGSAYEITDPTHPLAGSDVSAATLTAQGIPVPAHGGPPAPVNYPARAGNLTAAVVSGPAQTSKEQIGAAVEQAAESGPSLNIAPVKARAQTMWGKSQPSALTEGGGDPALGYFGSASSPDEQRALLERAGIKLEPDHPLPGVLGKLADLPDDLSFLDAHKFKRMLDDAIKWKPAGAVKPSARGQLAQITKGVRGQIRSTMTGPDPLKALHPPYEQASAAYREVSRLFSEKGLARQIQGIAEVNPEHLVNTLVNPKQATKFRMLREVLTHHAEAGGGPEGAAAGTDAWHAVQSSVMYKHLIQPGLDKFDASVAKMNPEFLDILTGDPYAKQVFDRLGMMSEAVKASEARTASEVATHTAARTDALNLSRVANSKADAITAQGVRDTAQAGVDKAKLARTQREAGRSIQQRTSVQTPRERAFAQSSLGKPQASAAQQLGDVAYAAVAPSGSPRQVAGAFRLLARGPKTNDLIHWASLTSDNTQMFVRAVSSPNAGQAVAALARGVDELMKQHRGEFPQMAVGHAQGKAATPPPGPGR